MRLKLATRAASSLLLATVLCATAAAQTGVPVYQAEYQVLYKGRSVGRSEFAVGYAPESMHYTFSSKTSVKGLLKLLMSGAATERSVFLAEPQGLRPLEYWYDDGSRKGEDNLHIVFDWSSGLATSSGEDGMSEVPLRPGVLDRGTLQVALMMDMSAGLQSKPYWLVDGSALASYEYSLDGMESITVPAGTFDVERYTQQREGSTRRTLLWVAPALRYLAVRIEQQRDGETRTAFLLESATGLGDPKP